MSEHARLSPSAAHRWMRCPGSLGLEEMQPAQPPSKYADEGTAAHELAARVLTGDVPDDSGYSSSGFKIDEDMHAYISDYVERVKEYAALGTLLIEQRVDFSQTIGFPDSFGTADALVLTNDDRELILIDLKYGRGVKVDADANEQLMIYALGVLETFGAVLDFSKLERVRLVIIQPRLSHLSEWDCGIDELREFGMKVSAAAKDAVYIAGLHHDSPAPLRSLLTPGEKQCKFCKAKAVCPALSATVEEAIAAKFEDLSEGEAPPVSVNPLDLALKMLVIPLIEDWCKAVRAEVERQLFAGVNVPGWKLVEGKRGNRKWVDEGSVEEAFASLGIAPSEFYDYSVISPATALKRFKSSAYVLDRISALIVQSEGKPSVASADDKRPAISVANIAGKFDLYENEQ